MIIRMINKFKQYKNKCLNIFKENTNKQLNEIKIIQDMKEKFNEDKKIAEK
jgi:hypothetical protein